MVQHQTWHLRSSLLYG